MSISLGLYNPHISAILLSLVICLREERLVSGCLVGWEDKEEWMFRAREAPVEEGCAPTWATHKQRLVTLLPGPARRVAGHSFVQHCHTHKGWWRSVEDQLLPTRVQFHSPKQRIRRGPNQTIPQVCEALYKSSKTAIVLFTNFKFLLYKMPYTIQERSVGCDALQKINELMVLFGLGHCVGLQSSQIFNMTTPEHVTEHFKCKYQCSSNVSNGDSVLM